jgi:dienelactone hydrolase
MNTVSRLCAYHLFFAMLPLVVLPLQASNLSLEQRISASLDTPALKGKALWLETGTLRFLSIHTPTQETQVHGGAILLHEATTHADWSDVIRPLRQHLSNQGWDTLSLQLPVTQTTALPPQALDTLLQQAVPRIQAAIDYFTEKKQQDLVLVGHGLGGIMALYFATQQTQGNLRAIAAIGIAIPTDAEKDPVRHAIAQLEIPLLDLYGSRDLITVRHSAPERRRIARDHDRKDFYQVEIVGADHFFSGMPNSLTRRIHAWLKRAKEAK